MNNVLLALAKSNGIYIDNANLVDKELQDLPTMIKTVATDID